MVLLLLLFCDMMQQTVADANGFQRNPRVVTLHVQQYSGVLKGGRTIISLLAVAAA